MCGLQDGITADLGASLNTERVAYASAPPGQTLIDIELPGGDDPADRAM